MRPLLVIFLFVIGAVAQTPPIEPGVSHELAKWRAARYSNVSYKLNLTFEKMSPVLKGSIEIRVNISAGTQAPSPANAGSSGVTDIPIILDWRKIKGSENLSTISNVSINGLGAVLDRPGGPDFSGPLYSLVNEHLVLSNAKPGENVIKLDFTSPILASGSAITRYIDKEDGSEYIYSLFVPSDASTAFPVFDQPDLKARIKLFVTIKSLVARNVVSNTEKLGEFVGRDGVHSVEFAETLPISTYLFSFAAGNFVEYFEKDSGGEKISRRTYYDNGTSTVYEPRKDVYRIYVRQSQEQKFTPHSEEIFRLNREGIKFLEQYFDYKFPFPKYDLVLIPEFPFGGMEHAGATFLRESAIIFPQEPTRGDHISRANLIFHEAAHQWFGDTVTMKWFDDLWLKEGFAEFMAYKTLERVMPEANAWKVFYERNKQAAYLTDSTKGTTPIYQKIDNLSAAKSAYGNIVYRKAPSFLKQAEFYIGPDKFQTAVRALLKKHEFANAGWEDLVGEFAMVGKRKPRDCYSVAGCEQANAIEERRIPEWANIWVTKPGLPKFRVHRMDTANGFLMAYGVRQELGAGGTVWPENFNLLWAHKNGRKEVLPGSVTTGITGFIGDMASYNTKLTMIFPNYGDYGYGIFLLDDQSREYVLKNIHNEKDAFLRSMMWGSLWDSVREGELDPKAYVELVIRQLGGSTNQGNDQIAKARASARAIANGGTTETDETIVSSLVGRVSLALNYYMPSPDIALADARASATEQLRSQFEAVLLDRMRNAPTAGQRITFFRAFVNNASTDEGRAELKKMLAQPSTTLTLKAKDKFEIVTRLAVLGDADAAKLLAELEKTETSDDAKRYAYAARAGFATAENKAKYWSDVVSNRDISESWFEAAFGPWNSIRHNELTLPYLQKALQELPNHKRNRKIFFINGWLSAFIGGQRSEEALSIVNKFLADNPSLDNDLRLKILENVDLIERAVKIRKKWNH